MYIIEETEYDEQFTSGYHGDAMYCSSLAFGKQGSDKTSRPLAQTASIFDIFFGRSTLEQSHMIGSIWSNYLITPAVQHFLEPIFLSPQCVPSVDNERMVDILNMWHYHHPHILPRHWDPAFFVQISDLEPTRYVSIRTVPVIPVNGRLESCRDGDLGVCEAISMYFHHRWLACLYHSWWCITYTPWN